MLKRLIIIVNIIVLFLTGNMFSQLSFTSYSVYAVGVSTGSDKKVTGELKAFFNRNMSDAIFELSGRYNFEKKDYHRFSAGLGISMVPFTEIDIFHSLSLPVQLEIYPLQNFKQLSLVVELAPLWVLEWDREIEMRHLWGIRYVFGKKS